MKNALWQTVLGEIELTVPHASFVTWFKNTVLLEQDDDKVVIGVPNIFAKQQLEAKFNKQIMDMLIKNGVEVKQVTFAINSATKNKKRVDQVIEGSQAGQAVQQQSRAVQNSESAKANIQKNGGLNPKYTFDSFIVGSSNELAYTACLAAANNPGTKYNPLFIYGNVGLGKTHLIQAVGNFIIGQDPSSRILYVSTETFVSEYVNHIRYKKAGFADRYRSVDVLIIDDMQFIAGKEKTQEEFFHTFNALHQANKQVIISSDKPPKSIPTLTDRLRSRFEWGMAIDIQTPDFETRCAILQTKASQSNIALDTETVEYLAINIQTNIRELEGALNQLIALCELRGTKPDIQMASGLIGNVKETRPHHLTIKQIIDKTAKHFQVDSVDIMSPKRDKHIVVPRQIAMYLLRSELHLSFPKIARELGRKDHTTAIHSVEKIEKAIKLDHIIRHQVTELRDKLYA